MHIYIYIYTYKVYFLQIVSYLPEHTFYPGDRRR